MHEIEAKIHLSKKEFDQLKMDLSQKRGVVYKGHLVKEDIYYEHPVPHLTLRLRQTNKKSQFQVKYRSVKQGIEVNREWEWGLKRPLVFKKLLKKAGLKPYIRKVKKTDLFVWKKMNIELNWVKGLGYFLEIEKLVKNEKSSPKAIQDVKEIFKALGFSKRPLEEKPYLQLLQINTTSN